MHLRTSRGGFTLLELLVVIAIVAVLFALFLPAVQKVREAAARITCTNNLKQLGLALHQYHDTHRLFPPGCGFQNGADPQPHMSWMTRLLPFLEQQALWQQSLQAFAQKSFFEDPPHRPILGRALPSFACPSDGRTSRPYDFKAFQVGLTSYQGAAGTHRTAFDGVLYLDSRTRLTDILDGTSNTLAVGERPPSADYTLGWWYAGWGQDKDGSIDLHLGARERNVMPRYARCGPGPFPFRRGDVRDDCAMFHFWSLHPGGGNFLFADGSVRFLRYEADAVLPALATRAGGEVGADPF